MVIRFIKYNIVFALSLCSIFSYAQNSLSQKQKEDLSTKANALIIKGTPSSTYSSKQEIIEKAWADLNVYNSYKEALVLWQQLLTESPNNANLNYKVGLCYFFSYDGQLKALPYFKKAAKNMSAAYSFISASEDKAPYTALYFLAETFLENNQADSALKYFSVYQDKHGINAISTERGMSMSVNTKNAEKNPRNVKVKNMGTKINSKYAEANPVVKINNSMLFFSSRRPSADDANNTSEDIYISTKENDMWATPQAFRFNTKFDEAPLFVSMDGLSLYFKRTENNQSDIYKSEFKDGVWNQPIAVKELNSPFNEDGLSMTGDGKTVYFSSDRNKATGRFDIFKSTKNEKGTWSAPVLLSATINSAFDEITPFITPDGTTLFFSSNASAGKGLGGFDVYYSERTAKGWGESQNMGYPINKCRNDVNYYVSANDKRCYASLTENNSYDLFEIEGGGFDFESISNMDVVTVTNEMGVTSVMETEKKVEKEVEVTQTIETEVEKEKEVEVIKTVETEKEKEVEVASGNGQVNVSDVNVENLSAEERAALVEKVKNYLAQQLNENESVKFKVVYFDFNKSNLSLLSLNELKLLVEFLSEHPETKIEIAGHGDNIGTWATNLDLSAKRAKEVYDFLIANKVNPNRMFYYGKGSAVPIAANDTEANRSKNRRVEVFILK